MATWSRLSRGAGGCRRWRVGGIEPGHVFIPFHYGYWDDDRRPRAANELTLTEWEPVSKQPHFKYAAVRIHKLQPIGAHVGETIGSAADTLASAASAVVTAVTGSRKEA